MKFKIKNLLFSIILIILIFSLFTYVINIGYALNDDSEGFATDFLRGLGIPSKGETEKPQVIVPRLNEASSKSTSEIHSINSESPMANLLETSWSF